MHTPRRLAALAFCLATAAPLSALDSEGTSTHLNSARMTEAMASPVWSRLSMAGSAGDAAAILRATLGANSTQADKDALALIAGEARDASGAAVDAAALAKAGFALQGRVLQGLTDASRSSPAFLEALASLQSQLGPVSAGSVADLRASLERLFNKTTATGQVTDAAGSAVPGQGLGTPKIELRLRPASHAQARPTSKIPDTAEELVEMFGNSRSIAKNLNATILAALAARHDVSEEEMRRRVANIVKMYPLLESQKAANAALYKLFSNDNAAQPGALARLSRVQHEAWLANEKAASSFIPYTQRLHQLLWSAVKEGAVLVPTAPVKDHVVLSQELFENPGKKFKLQAKHFDFANEARKAGFARDFLEVTGRKFEDNWAINTIGGEWDALAAIPVGAEPRAKRASFLNGLQQDNVASALAAIHSQKIIHGLETARTPDQFLDVIADMTRIVNVGWRLNNPWFGFNYRLQYRPFHPDPNIGIGIGEIRKDTITLKATLELLRDDRGIVLPKEVRAALEAAFSQGLGQALEQAVQPDARALSQAILKQKEAPVTLAADQSNILEYLAWIFSRQDLIEQHMSGETLEVLAQAFDKKGRADVVRNIENALAILEVLEHTQDANDAAHTALAAKVPLSVRYQLARLGHQAWLEHERRSLGKRFVEHSAGLQQLLLDSAELATIDYHGRRLMRADLASPRGRFRLTAANFRRQTEQQRQAFAEFERRFAALTGEAFSDPDGEPLVELNTFAAPWRIQTGLAPDALAPRELEPKARKRWSKDREKGLYDFQAHAFTPVFTALFDEQVLGALAGSDEDARQDALLRIARRIDTNTRLDDADRGFSRLKLAYDVTTEGGVGVEAVAQDVLMLSATLKTIAANLNGLRLPPATRARARQALSRELLASAERLADRDTLVRALERNRVRENFTLAAEPEPAQP